MNLERILSEVEREQKRVFIRDIVEDTYLPEFDLTPKRKNTFDVKDIEDGFIGTKNPYSRQVSPLLQKCVIENLEIIDEYLSDIIPYIIKGGLRSGNSLVHREIINKINIVEKYFPSRIIKTIIGLGTISPDYLVQKAAIEQFYALSRCRNPDLTFREILNSSKFEELEVQRALIDQMKILEKFVPEYTPNILNWGLNNESLYIQEGIYKQLKTIGKTLPEKIPEIIEKGLKTKEMWILKAILEELETVKKYAPEKIDRIFDIGIKNSEHEIILTENTIIDNVIKYAPERIPELAQNLLKKAPFGFRRLMMKIDVDSIDQNTFENLFKKIKKKKNIFPSLNNKEIEPVRYVEILEKYAPEKIPEFIKGMDLDLKEKSKWFISYSLNELDFFSRYYPEKVSKIIENEYDRPYMETESLKYLDIVKKICPEKIPEVIKRKLDCEKSEDKNWFYRDLDSIAEMTNENISEIIEKCIDDVDLEYLKNNSEYMKKIFKYSPEKVEKWVKSELKSNKIDKKISSIIKIHELNLSHLINPSEHSFLREYLDSKYLYKKNEDDIIKELKNLVQTPNKNYHLMTQILQRGRAKNLDDIIECSEFESENELFLTKLSKQGKVGTTYLVDNVKKGDMVFKVVKGKLESIIETRNALELSHQDIVRVNTTGKITRNGEEVEGVLMDYIEGEDLKEVMDKNPHGLEERLFLRYSTQLFDIIKYMISENIEHCDLHLDNVRVSSKDNRIKALDYGTCRRIDKENTYNEKYNRLFGGTNDLFSWSLLTYKMITGRHLLSDGKEYATDDDYKNRILEEKRELRNEDGTIKQIYRERIEKNLSEYQGLQKPIITALENKDELSPSGLVGIIEREINEFQDQRIKSQLEKEFGELSGRELAMYQRYKELNRGEA